MIAEDYEIIKNHGNCPICGRRMMGVVIDLKIVSYECPQCNSYILLKEPKKLKPITNYMEYEMDFYK